MYYLWEGVKLSKVQFRVLVFCTLYERLVIETDRFKDLKAMHDGGMNLYLLDFESYDILEEGVTLKEAMLDPDHTWGHSMILYGILTNNTPWRDKDLGL